MHGMWKKSVRTLRVLDAYMDCNFKRVMLVVLISSCRLCNPRWAETMLSIVLCSDDVLTTTSSCLCRVPCALAWIIFTTNHTRLADIALFTHSLQHLSIGQRSVKRYYRRERSNILVDDHGRCGNNRGSCPRRLPCYNFSTTRPDAFEWLQ